MKWVLTSERLPPMGRKVIRKEEIGGRVSEGVFSGEDRYWKRVYSEWLDETTEEPTDQEMILFAEWCHKNSGGRNGDFWLFRHSDGLSELVSSEDLLKLYKSIQIPLLP